jgi:hypothetical protein
MPTLFQQKIDQSHRPVKNFSTERLVERGLCPAGDYMALADTV